MKTTFDEPEPEDIVDILLLRAEGIREANETLAYMLQPPDRNWCQEAAEEILKLRADVERLEQYQKVNYN